MFLGPEHNNIEINIIERTCTVVGVNQDRKRHGYMYHGPVISQTNCLEIMELARQAGYTFDISKANNTRVFKNFFASLGQEDNS